MKLGQRILMQLTKTLIIANIQPALVTNKREIFGGGFFFTITVVKLK